MKKWTADGWTDDRYNEITVANLISTLSIGELKALAGRRYFIYMYFSNYSMLKV